MLEKKHFMQLTEKGTIEVEANIDGSIQVVTTKAKINIYIEVLYAGGPIKPNSEKQINVSVLAGANKNRWVKPTSEQLSELQKTNSFAAFYTRVNNRFDEMCETRNTKFCPPDTEWTKDSFLTN